jgi:hypothetical protein
MEEWEKIKEARDYDEKHKIKNLEDINGEYELEDEEENKAIIEEMKIEHSQVEKGHFHVLPKEEGYFEFEVLDPNEKFETEEESEKFLEDLMKWHIIEYDDIQKSLVM